MTSMWLWVLCLVLVAGRAQDVPSNNSLDSVASAQTLPSFSQPFPSVFSQAPTSFDAPQQARVPASDDQIALDSAPSSYSMNYAQPSNYVDQNPSAQPSQQGYYYYYYPIQKTSDKKGDHNNKLSLLSLLTDLPSSDLLHMPDFLSKGSDFEKVKAIGITASVLLVVLGGLLLLMPLFNFNGRRSVTADWINSDNLNILAEFVLKSIDSYNVSSQ